jgi:4-hydroxybenzoate polyprenyltransferase
LLRLLWSNAHVPFLILALYHTTQVLFLDELKFSFYDLLLFGASMAVYGGHRILQIRLGWREMDKSDIDAIKKISLSEIYLGAFIGLWALPYLERTILLMQIPAALVTLLYIFPVLKTSQGSLSLRNSGLFKPLFVAVTATWVTATVPLIHSFSELELASYSFSHFLFLMAITLPFDLRDLEVDRRNGLRTMAHSAGRGSVVNLSLMLLGTEFLLSLFLVSGLAEISLYWLAVAITNAFAVFVILQIRRPGSPLWFWMLEASIALRFALVLVLAM